MADKSENIGSLSVDITADTETALDSLKTVEGKLSALAAKQTVLKLDTENFNAVLAIVDKVEKSLSSITKTGGEVPVIKVDGTLKLNVDAPSIRASIKEAMKEPFAINFTVGNLDAIKEELKGLQVPVSLMAGDINLNGARISGSASGGGGGGGGLSGDALKRINAIIDGAGSAGDALENAYKQINAALEKSGNKPLGDAGSRGEMLANITRRYGTQLVDPRLFGESDPKKVREMQAGGMLGADSLKQIGIGRPGALIRSLAEVQSQLLGPTGGGKIDIKKLLTDAIEGSVGSGGLVINLGGSASVEMNGTQQERAVTQPPAVDAVLERVRAKNAEIMARRTAERDQALGRVVPIDLGKEVSRLLADQKRTSAASTRPDNTGAPATPAAAAAAEIARKEAFLESQRAKLELERANPPVGPGEADTKDLMPKWQSGLAALEASISQTEKRIETLKRGKNIQPGARASIIYPDETNAAANAEAEKASGYISSLNYGTLREGDVDLTDMLRLANRGAFKNVGILKTTEEQTTTKDRAGKETGKERKIRVPKEQYIELTDDQDRELGQRTGPGFRNVGGNLIRRANPLDVFKEAVGQQFGPEGVALIEKSLQAEGENSPVTRALRGILPFPSGATASPEGDAFPGRSGAGGNSSARPSGSKPNAGSIKADEEAITAMAELRRTQPMLYNITRQLMRDEAGARRGEIAGELSDKDLNKLFRTKGKDPMEVLERTLTHAVGIQTGQLVDPSVLVGALDEIGKSNLPARGMLIGQKNPETQEWTPTDFRPGAVQSELQKMVGSILMHPDYLAANPQNAELDTSKMSIKQMAGALRKTKTSIADSKGNLIPTDLSYLADVLTDLPQIAFERDRVGQEAAGRLSDTGREGMRTTESMANRRINTPAQQAYLASRKAELALNKQEADAVEAARNAEIEKTAGRLGIEPVRLQPGDREPVGAVGKIDYLATAQIARKRSRGLDSRLSAAEAGVRADFASRRSGFTERGGSAPAGISYIGEQGEAGRNLLAPETEAALGFIAAQSGTSFGITLPRLAPRVGGRKAESAAAKSRSRQVVEPIIQAPVVPEGAPTGKAILESAEFAGLAKSIQDEVRALIEIKDDKGNVAGYRGVGQIGQPVTAEGRPMTTGNEVREKYASEYPGVVPHMRYDERGRLQGAGNPTAATEVVQQIMNRIKGIGATADIPSSEDTLHGAGAGAAAAVISERSERGAGGIAGTINVNVIKSVPLTISGWEGGRAAAAGAAVGAAAAGGGGGGEPPAPSEGTPGEPEEPTGKRRKGIRTRNTRLGMLPIIEFDDSVGYNRPRQNDIRFQRNTSVSRLPVEPEVIANRREFATRQRMFVGEVAKTAGTEASGNIALLKAVAAQLDALENPRQARTPRAARFDARNADVFSQEQDRADDNLASIRARLRTANRQVPKRGFGASLTDLVTGVVGGSGFEKQLEFISRSEKEAGEISGLSGQNARARANARVTGARLRQIGTSAQPGDTPEIAAERAQLLRQLRTYRTEHSLNQRAIKRSTDRFEENIKAATNANTVLKSFGAAAVGGIASTAIGSITTGLGFAVTGPLIQAVSEGLTQAVGPAVERALGNPNITAQQVGAADQIVAQTGGRRGLEEATFAQANNLTLTQAQTIGGNVLNQAEIEQGNKNLAQAGGLLLADRRLAATGTQGITRGTSGQFGTPIGQVASTAEVIAGLYDQLPNMVPGVDIGPNGFPTGMSGGFGGYGVGPGAAQTGANQPTGGFGAYGVGPGAEQKRALGITEGATTVSNALTTDTRTLSDWKKTTDFLNMALERGGESVVKFGKVTDKVSQEQLNAQAQILRIYGGEGGDKLAKQIERRQVALFSGNQVSQSQDQILTALAAIPKGAIKNDYNTLLGLAKPQLQAQFGVEDLKGEMARGTGQFAGKGILESQFGLEYAQNPLGSATSSIAKQDQGKVKGLGETVALYKEIDKEGEQAVTTAKNFVATWATAPGVADQFNAALDTTVKIGNEISKIQVGVETEHAEYAAKQYNVQIYQTKRSLTDAVNLQKALNGERATGLGQIQGQEFLLQRQSQALGLALSQKQINFQKAIAGITAPGLTGEERAARIEQAKIEADYAQKQLDIQKKLFALGGKSFRIQVDRSVFDLSKQLGLLTEGRAITINDAAAQKKIAALNIKMAKEMKIVNNIFDQAQTRANDMLELTGKFATELEKDAASVFSDLTNYYINFYKRMTGLANAGGGGGGNAPQGPKYNASGFLGTVSGATSMIMGEAGTETVAILRNPRNATPGSGGGGGGPVINVFISGNKFSTPEEEAKLARRLQTVIERSMGFKGSMYGLRRV